ncbi:Peroxidase 41 [Linum grandiflorum]
MKDTVTRKQLSNPTTAAAVLRLFFHDCMVDGCDGSTLVASTPFHKSERDASLNLNLPGDAFEMVVRAKTELELECPNVVSCTDVLALATRNLITMVGGPFYPVRLGRKDDGLKKLCKNYTKDPTMSAFNDVMTPGKFDNMYYQNLERGLGLLSSDEGLYMDQRTKPFVELYAKNESAFFQAFAQAMEKVSIYKVKTGNDGEVRHRCDQINTVKI